MKFEDWKPLYDEILAEFRFDPVADEAAASELAAFLQQAGCDPGAVWRDLRARLGGRGCIVLGAADEAPERLAHAPTDWPLVAADGATTAALEVGRLPDLIVTDLDGRVEDEVAAAARGSLVAVHAHGDNREALARWLPRFPPARLAGTCQCRPVPPLRNEGGFTDGDRAAFLAHALGASSLLLAGFSLEARPGRYTGSFDPRNKPRKLAWAKRLLSRLGEDTLIRFL